MSSHDHGGHMMSSDSSSSDMSTMGNSTMDMGEDEAFCMGTGTVMLMGFQAAADASVGCVLFLFKTAAVDTEAKYSIAVIGIFLMAFSNEMIRYGRGMIARNATDNSFTADLMKTGAFAVQMTLAYFLMLLVMLYEYVFLIMIILGLSTGHLVTLRLAAARKAGQKLQQQETPYSGSSGTPCCNTSTEC